MAGVRGRDPKVLFRKSVMQVVFAAYSVVVIYPMVWLMYTSFKSSRELFANAWALPTKLHWENFVNAWRDAQIGSFFFNSVFVTMTTVAIQLVIGAMASYALARYRFKGNSLLYYFFLAGLMFPIFLALVPMFFLLRDLGLLDTHTGLISVYVASGIPFTVFVLTAFFKTIPKELEEAGFIDGCSHFGVFWRIMLPLAKPGLIAVAIFTFIAIWNEYVLALVVISSSALRTLPLGIANLMMVEHYKTDWGSLFAGLVIVMLPTIIGYAVLQERITKGITVGALKG
ncbi:MAG TPA: carbohydrate ABC transporter permease [Candidatus Latescibacteria bacterium]|nr:carbohydrate ABC transporter permease [Candidatus Latescibacterota bacterium]